MLITRKSFIWDTLKKIVENTLCINFNCIKENSSQIFAYFVSYLIWLIFKMQMRKQNKLTERKNVPKQLLKI